MRMIVRITRDVILKGVTHKKGDTIEISGMSEFSDVYMEVQPSQDSPKKMQKKTINVEQVKDTATKHTEE